MTGPAATGAADGKPARVALIGATGHGLHHRKIIAELQDAGLVELVALADVRDIPDATVPTFTDHRALLAAAAPEVVVVCTPPHTHLPIATDVLTSGADLLLEKPPVLDLAEHAALAEVVARTGRACQIGFQALASPALTELLSTVDGGALGHLTGIAVRGAWMRDEAYFGRSPWAGRATVNGRPSLDGALANPFAHAVMQALAIALAPGGTPVGGGSGPGAGGRPPASGGARTLVGIEVERFRTRDIEVDDTATLRLTFDDGLRILVAVTLCAEEFVPGDITVVGTAGRAVLEYPTDRLQLPGESGLTGRPGRVHLLANLVAHRNDGTPLIVPLERTRPFTAVLESVTAAPVVPIPAGYLTTRYDLPAPRLAVTGVNAALDAAATGLSQLRELGVPWAVAEPGADAHPDPQSGSIPLEDRR